MNKFPPPLESIVAMLTNCDQPDQSDDEKKLEAQVRHQIQQYADQQSAELRAALKDLLYAEHESRGWGNSLPQNVADRIAAARGTAAALTH